MKKYLLKEQNETLLLRKLYQNYTNLGYRQTRNYHDAEELTGELFLLAIKKGINIPKSSNWLNVVFRNLVVNHYRKKSRRKQVFESDLSLEGGVLEQFVSSEKGPEEIFIQNEGIASVRSILTREILPERKKSLLIMYYFLDIPQKEIGEIIGELAGKVRGEMCQARKLVKQLIERVA